MQAQEKGADKYSLHRLNYAHNLTLTDESSMNFIPSTQRTTIKSHLIAPPPSPSAYERKSTYTEDTEMRLNQVRQRLCDICSKNESQRNLCELTEVSNPSLWSFLERNDSRAEDHSEDEALLGIEYPTPRTNLETSSVSESTQSNVAQRIDTLKNGRFSRNCKQLQKVLCSPLRVIKEKLQGLQNLVRRDPRV